MLALAIDLDGTLIGSGLRLDSRLTFGGTTPAQLLATMVRHGVAVAVITGNDLAIQCHALTPLIAELASLTATPNALAPLLIYGDGGTRLFTLRGSRFDEIIGYRLGQWPDSKHPARQQHDLLPDELAQIESAWQATANRLSAEMVEEGLPRVRLFERRIEIGPLADVMDQGRSVLADELADLGRRFEVHRLAVETRQEGRDIILNWSGHSRDAVVRALLGLAVDADLPRLVRLESPSWRRLATPRIEPRGSPGLISQLAIRPFKLHRRLFLSELRRELTARGLHTVSARLGGETTIDVQRAETTKATAIRDFAQRIGVAEAEITFIANEFYEGGNDRPVALDTLARCLNVGLPQPELLHVTTIGDGPRATWEHLRSIAAALWFRDRAQHVHAP